MTTIKISHKWHEYTTIASLTFEQFFDLEVGSQGFENLLRRQYITVKRIGLKLPYVQGIALLQGQECGVPYGELWDGDFPV